MGSWLPALLRPLALGLILLASIAGAASGVTGGPRGADAASQRLRVSAARLGDACPTGTAAVTGLFYQIDGKTTVTALAGNVHQGDTVQAFFTIATGCTGIVVSMASYTAPSAVLSAGNLLAQQLYNSATGTFSAGTHRLPAVTIPSCFFQLDVALGPVVTQFGTQPGQSYSGRLLAGMLGGTDSCSPPTATPEAPSAALFGSGAALVLLGIGLRSRRRRHDPLRARLLRAP